MTYLSEEGRIVRLTYEKKKQILMELATKNNLNQIAVSYGTTERTVQRVRRWALNNRGLRSSLDKKIQDYLTDWEKRPRKNKSVTVTNVPLENVTNQVTLTDKNHNEEQSFKPKITSRLYDNHIKTLSFAAIGMADLLYYFKLCTGEETLREMLDDDEDTQQYEKYEEFMKLLPSPEAKWLLSHIKSEAPKLFIHFRYAEPELFDHPSYDKPESKKIGKWEDMTMDDVHVYGEKLIDLLKRMAAQKAFPGTCEVCKGWK